MSTATEKSHASGQGAAPAATSTCTTTPRAAETPPTKDDVELDGEWDDVSSLVRSVCGEMKNGRMVHGEGFSLHSAMSALELMDPKMDSGMFHADTMTLERAIDEGLVPRDLAPADVLGVLDQLLACEASWCNGNTTGHTVFTCLYLHREDLITDPALRAFKVCILKTITLVSQSLLNTDIFDDEEFCFGNFDFDMNDDVTEEDMRRNVTDALVDVRKRVADEGLSKDERAIQEAIATRLEFVTQFYDVFAACRDFDSNGFPPLWEAMEAALSSLEAISSTLSLGTTPAPGFSISITRWLLSNSPPRSMPLHTREKACEYFRDMLTQFRIIREVTKLETFDNMWHVCEEISRLRPSVIFRAQLYLVFNKDNSFLYKGKPLTELLSKSMGDYCPTAEMCISSKLMSAPNEIELYLQRVSSAICAVFRMFCESPSRQRMRIVHALADWSVLQQDAAGLDNMMSLRAQQTKLDLQSPSAPFLRPFSSWAIDQAARLEAMYLFIGISFDLFADFELRRVYWYLEYLLDYRVRLRQVASKVPDVDSTPPPVAKKKKSGGKNRKKKGPKKQANAKPQHPLKHTTAPAFYKRLEAENLLARATHGIVTYAMQLKLVKAPTSPFGSAALRFAHRLQPFASVDQPRIADFDVCERELTSDASASLDKRKADVLGAYRNARSFVRAYLDRADASDVVGVGANGGGAASASKKPSQCAHDAPYDVERAYLESLLQVIERNLESVSALSKLAKKKTPVDLNFDFSLCRYFPWVRVVPRE